MFTSLLVKRALASRSGVPALVSSFARRHKHVPAAALATSHDDCYTRHAGSNNMAAAFTLLALAAAAATATNTMTTTTSCETKKNTKKKAVDDPSSWNVADVAKEDFDEVQKSHDIDKMPVYTSDQVAENNGEDGKPIWMSYGGVVYDVTKFIPNHPGGSEKIMTAAGSVSSNWEMGNKNETLVLCGTLNPKTLVCDPFLFHSILGFFLLILSNWNTIDN